MARNQHPGTCYECGLRVEAGTGHFEKRKGARGFRVKHGNVPGEGRVTCEEAKKDISFEAYQETVHPFSSEAFEP